MPAIRDYQRRSALCRVAPYAKAPRPPLAPAPALGKGSASQRKDFYPIKAPFQLNKKLGQHMLKSPAILEKIVSAASIKSTDTVLEIGPGTGHLTLQLLPIARRVVALDVDERMVGEVKKRALSMGYTNLDVKTGDALRTDLPKFDVCTANLPYQISSPFVFRLLAHNPPFRCAVLMFQKEFAERLLAKAGDSMYCRLSVNTQLLCKVERVCLVKAGCFVPPPKVDSMVVKLTPLRNNKIDVDFKEWDGLMRICFGRKRRTLFGNFNTKTTLGMLYTNYTLVQSRGGDASGTMELDDKEKLAFSKKLVEEAIEDAGLKGRRAVTVSVEEFLNLLVELNRRGVHFNTKSPGTADGVFANMDPDFYLNMKDDETESLEGD